MRQHRLGLPKPLAHSFPFLSLRFMMNPSGVEVSPSAQHRAHSQPSPMNEAFARQRDDLELLSIRNVTELLGVSRLSVNRLVERGLVPVYRVLSCVRFKRSDIVNFLAKNRTAAWRDEPYASKKN